MVVPSKQHQHQGWSAKRSFLWATPPWLCCTARASYVLPVSYHTTRLRNLCPRKIDRAWVSWYKEQEAEQNRTEAFACALAMPVSQRLTNTSISNTMPSLLRDVIRCLPIRRVGRKPSVQDSRRRSRHVGLAIAWWCGNSIGSGGRSRIWLRPSI